MVTLIVVLVTCVVDTLVVKVAGPGTDKEGLEAED